MSTSNPYLHLVPKDREKNLKFRKELLLLGASDPKAAEELWIMCSRDLLFYVNAFVWTYDPRLKSRVTPFITYEFQDDALTKLDNAIGREDLFIEKSRDMGASWMCIIAFEWQWHFKSMVSFLLGSRKEDLVDKSDDPRSLFWKIDFIHKHQPNWLKPNMNRMKLHLHNRDNGSTIDGESTNINFSKGDRRTAILLDEWHAVDGAKAIKSATADVTNSRVFNGTPQGIGHISYDMSQDHKVPKLRLHWPSHPVKAKGLHYDEAGLPHSPWYDRECTRRTAQEVAQELDINYLGADHQFFDPAVLEKHRNDHVRPPFIRGELDYGAMDGVPGTFSQQSNGRLRLWTQLQVGASGERVPYKDRDYVMGVDVATGTGSSNSVIVVADRKTREQVLEFAISEMKPHELAQFAVAVARWFPGKSDLGAFMIWEANGPGRIFGDVVVELGYRNFYYKANEKSLRKRMTDTPGWWQTKDSKLALLGEYRRALADDSYINRSLESLNECDSYVYLPNGSVAHARSAYRGGDPTGAKDNHGDRAIAAALACHAIREAPDEHSAATQMEEGDFAWRRKQWEDAQREKSYW